MKTQTRIGISVAALMLAGGAMLAVADSNDDCRGKGGMGYGGMGYQGDGGPMKGKGYGRHGGDSAKMQQRMLERLDQQLSLTDQQQQQLGDMMAQHQHQQQMPANRAQMQQFRDQMHSLDPAAADYTDQVESLAKQQSELFSQKMVERAKHHAELYALLTPEQQQQFRQLEQQRGERRGGHHRMW